ncbi:MAG: hypothetical protein M3R02_11720 [Chloroflexota bacterium]|nr:hypothetical protein [Chloroflexota bacterium]
MTTRRDMLKAGAGLALGATLPAEAATVAAQPAPMIGFLHVTDAQTFEPGGYGRVAVTSLPDGSYLVRPVRSGPQAWQDH